MNNDVHEDHEVDKDDKLKIAIAALTDISVGGEAYGTSCFELVEKAKNALAQIKENP